MGKVDRRIAKTKKAIYNAVFELMKEKEFDKITINEIADKADVNRGTVYLHFVDKYDLVDQCVDFFLSEFIEKMDSIDNVGSKESFLVLFKHFEENKDFYSLMLTNRNVFTFHERIFELMKNTFESKAKDLPIDPRIDKDILVRFHLSAGAGILEWWIRANRKISAEEMAEQAYLLLNMYGMI